MTQIETAVVGLVGTVIGGAISYFTQRQLHARDRAEKRKALAATIAAELDSYVDLMERRDHVATARAMIAQLQNGQNVLLRGFASRDEKPLDQFPLVRSRLGELGDLGSGCFDVGKFLSLVRGVRATVIEAERGRFDNYSPQQKVYLIQTEIKIWEEALALARSLVPRLKAQAGIE